MTTVEPGHQMRGSSSNQQYGEDLGDQGCENGRNITSVLQEEREGF